MTWKKRFIREIFLREIKTNYKGCGKMKILINYADEKYKKTQKFNTWTGKHIAKFDKVYSFGPEDIDEEYREKHKDIFNYKRGNGLWLWKSYFISKVMEECNEGDYVFYVDSGAFFLRNVDTIIKSMRKGEQIQVSDCPLLESCFTKKECFEKMECNEAYYKNSNQIQGGFFLAICNENTRKFVKMWQRYSEQLDIISPEGGLDITDAQGSEFVSHREDQSILSLLCKKYNIKAHRDPSQRGKCPETFYNEKYAYRVPEHSEDHYKSFVFLHKSPTVNIIDCSKLIIKSMMIRKIKN